MKLEEIWFQINEKYCSDNKSIKSNPISFNTESELPDILKTNKIIELAYEEILRNYSEKERHYHGLSHLKSLFSLAEEYKEHIVDFEIVAFSIFYHDIIYKAWKKDNEEQSAIFATKELSKLNLPKEKIERIKNLILATKKHKSISDNFDDNFFLDIDLAILGTDENTYNEYTKKVREEYAFVPFFMYKSGRKKVLESILESENIYKTELIKNRFEEQARKNILTEIKALS